MLHVNADTGNRPIEEAIRNTQFLTFRFLLRLKRQYPQRLITLKAGVFDEGGIARILNRCLIRHFLVVGLPAISRAQIIDTFGVCVSQN